MPADSQPMPSPPRHEPDPVLARQLRTILLGMIAIFTVGTLLLILTVPEATARWLAFAATMSGLCLGCLYVLRLGRARPSAILLVCGLLAITTGMAATSGGVPSPGTMAYLTILPTAAILLGRRAAALTGAAIITCVLALLLAQAAGWLPPALVQHTPLTVSIIFGLFLAALLLVHKSVFDTVARAERASADSAARSRDADAALRQSEQRLSFALEAVNDGLYDLNLLTGQAYCSPRYFTMLGYGPTELSASVETWSDLLHPDDRAHALEQVTRYATGEIDHHEFEVRMRTRAGGWRWILTRGRLAERTPDGRPQRLIGTHVDVTDRREAEAAARASDLRLRSIADHAPFGAHIYELSPDDRLILVGANRPADRILHLDHRPLFGKEIEEAFPGLKGTDIPATYRRVARTGESVQFEQVSYDNDEIKGVFEVHALQSGPDRMTVFFTNIAERKQLEEQLRHSQKMEVFGQLASGVAHDFNNLLVVINGNSEILLREPGVDTTLREPIEQIHEAGTRAAALTRQLLLFSRKHKPQTQQADLAAIVGNLVKLLRRVIGEHINLSLEFAPTPLPVLADVNMIEQVMMNLAVNARDAMPHGGLLTIRTHATALTDVQAALPGCRPGPYAVLRVRDNGAGIPPEIHSRIFDPFFTTKEAGKGTGLGLSTVLAILQQHDGGITFTSEAGKGTEFVAYLPLASAPSGPTGADAARAAVAAVGRAATILLVEDEESVRRTTARLLRAHGLAVEEAGSGAEALRRLPALAGHIDLVLSDIVMPGGVDGLALAREIAQRWPALPVILMTGYTRETEPIERPLLHKPFTLDALLGAVRAALGSKPGRS